MNAKTLGAACGILFINVLFAGGFALLTNWIISFVADWPVTLQNVFITWGCIVVLRVIFGKKS